MIVEVGTVQAQILGRALDNWDKGPEACFMHRQALVPVSFCIKRALSRFLTGAGATQRDIGFIAISTASTWRMILGLSARCGEASDIKPLLLKNIVSKEAGAMIFSVFS
ncbi:hypothetical protein EVAR_54591_1 [Eumeta japonica]|uniref:Uncharacterized protein n=1 Tax=Eumeta variegata TaxID=151549 RepID=A0A4C1YNE2_EUMVA|nr:hypothetical protein EVAR_54591_1 [Eumeta japonica]